MKLFKKDKDKGDKSQREGARKTLENSAMAAAFAEAGEHEEARRILDAGALPCRKILVISAGTSFSDRVMDYAVKMAKRLNCPVMAANIYESSHGILDFLGDSNKQAFSQTAEENISSFRRLAQDNGIEFEHTVRFGDSDQVVDQIYKEQGGNISYVITEPDPELVDSSGESATIPVFGFANAMST